MYKILANTLFLGKNVIFVPECPSTNTLLLDMTQKMNQPEGTLVITNKQTHGRGQRGNGWEAEQGKNLTFSILIKPNFLSIQDQFYLTIAISLGIRDFLVEQLSKDIKIKWPNDLMVGQKKIAGILIENSLAGESLQQSVVGIGLNVNQTSFSVGTATSMALIAEKEFNLVTELNFLMEKLENRYLQLRTGRATELKDAYIENLFRRGEDYPFMANGQQFMGSIQGIDGAGKLKLAINGAVACFGLKEISFMI